MRAGTTDPAGEDLVSLVERTSYIQALRVGFAVVILGTAVFAPQFLGASLSDLLFVTAGYLCLSAAAEALRRSMFTRGVSILEGMLLVDALYLALAGYATGGTQSPLRFLVYIHLIAVTLLASYPTGIKVAVWHSLLFIATFYAQASDILPPVREVVAGDPNQPSAFNVLALLLVAVATMVFSRLNERDLRRRKADLEALADTARRLEDESEAKQVAAILLEGIAEAFGFKRGAVLAAPAGDPLALLAYRGPGEPVDLRSARLDDAIESAWEGHEPKLFRKLALENNPRLSALFPLAHNLAIIPLFAEGPVGIVAVEHPNPKGRGIRRRLLMALQQFASHAALALRKAWLMQEVRRQADVDGLTGIANRRSFQARLDKEISRAQRNSEMVTLVMLDIDNFKSLNDTQGHQAGDEVLRRTGRALERSCRDFDTPARYGGEEFAVILPGCSPAESTAAADRFRAAIAGTNMPVAVTASAGAATYPVNATNPEALIHAADEALYASKRAGRDRSTPSNRTVPTTRVLDGSG